MYGLTQLVVAVGTAAELSGHTRRVAALLRGLEHVDATTSSWRRREEEEWQPKELKTAPREAQSVQSVATGGRGRRRTSKENDEPLLEGRRLCVSVPPSTSPGTSSRALGARGTDAELLSRVELCVRAGGSVLIQGAAGIGKTALLRTICGLWPMGERQASKPMSSESLATSEAAEITTSTSEIAEITCVPPLWNTTARAVGSPTYLVLPQSAPLRPGMETSLLEQLVYPLLYADGAAEAALDALEAVGLSSLLSRLGGLHTPHRPAEWHAALSPGQRQLLVCARIFVHAPALVLLDEATSALPATDEARIYSKLRERGIAYLSIGHRTSLEAHHDQTIDLGVAHQ